MMYIEMTDFSAGIVVGFFICFVCIKAMDFGIDYLYYRGKLRRSHPLVKGRVKDEGDLDGKN